MSVPLRIFVVLLYIIQPAFLLAQHDPMEINEVGYKNWTKKNTQSLVQSPTTPLVTGDADADFKNLSKILRSLDFNQKKPKDLDYVARTASERYLNNEKVFLEYRTLGMKLWHGYPEDERRYEWFRRTVLRSFPNINYWSNIYEGNISRFSRSSSFMSYNAAIDWESLVAWEEEYAKMKDEYFEYLRKKSNLIGDSLRVYVESVEFKQSELRQFLMWSQNSAYRNRDGNDMIDLKLLESLSIGASTILSISEEKIMDRRIIIDIQQLKREAIRILDQDFLAGYSMFGLTDNDLLQVLDRFVESKRNSFEQKNWARQRKIFLNLKWEPFELDATALDGRKIDLTELRGKVVLLDFWGTSCSSCIERMPAIKKIYDKYKNKGFEVISLCRNYGEEMERILAIEKEIAADWPLVLIGSEDKEVARNSSLGARIWKKYGFFSVPVLLLLNKEGRMVMFNDILIDGDFEPLLIELLKG